MMTERTIPGPVDPALAGDESTTLANFLDFFRSVLIRKGDGMTREQLAAPAAASTLTIGRLIRHMTLVDSHWFEQAFAGRREPEPWASADWDADRDWEMSTADGMSFGDLRMDFERACDLSRSIVRGAESLNDLATVEDHGRQVSLRWIMVHMIEEYARHCGHADLIAEAVDGRLGD